MNTVLQIAKIVSLVALAFFLGELGYTAHQFRKSVAKTTPQLVQKMDTDLNEFHAVLTETYKITNDTRVTLDNLNKAAIDERFYFEKQVPQVMGEVSKLLQTTDTAVAGLQTTTTAANTLLDTTTRTVVDVQPVLANLSNTSQSLETLITDPSIKATLSSIQQTSANTAEATAQAAQILKDGRVVADKYIAPERWFVKVLHFTLQGGSLAYDFIR